MEKLKKICAYLDSIFSKLEGLRYWLEHYEGPFTTISALIATYRPLTPELRFDRLQQLKHSNSSLATSSRSSLGSPKSSTMSQPETS